MPHNDSRPEFIRPDEVTLITQNLGFDRLCFILIFSLVIIRRTSFSGLVIPARNNTGQSDDFILIDSKAKTVIEYAKTFHYRLFFSLKQQ